MKYETKALWLKEARSKITESRAVFWIDDEVEKVDGVIEILVNRVGEGELESLRERLSTPRKTATSSLMLPLGRPPTAASKRRSGTTFYRGWQVRQRPLRSRVPPTIDRRFFCLAGAGMINWESSGNCAVKWAIILSASTSSAGGGLRDG